MIGLPEEAIAAKYLIKTHFVARVLKFYPETQTVDVVQDTYDFSNTVVGDIVVKNEFGQNIVVGLMKPVILYGIPVQQIRWGQFSIQACPKEGDTGYIEVFTNDISSWMKDGGIAIPSSDRHFTKENSVFVPFMANQQNADANYVNNENTLVIKSANASITLTDNGTSSDVKILSKTVHVEAQNGMSIKGDVAVTGKITATKNIESSQDVKAGTITLKTHKHGFTYNAGSTAGATGTTAAAS